MRKERQTRRDFGEIIATNQVDPHDPAQGTDPDKEALNTIDAGGPSSDVELLPATNPPSCEVHWSGQDDSGGSGIATYDVFVSDDGGPFTLWQTATTDTQATFVGQSGHTYAFYSVATDNVGHVETAPATPDTSTLVETQVVGRHLFYDNSSYDGDPGASVNDDLAIAAGIQPLAAGESASSANYSNYHRGLNGLMVDVQNLAEPSLVGLADFEFHVGNDNSPGTWATAPAPIEFAIRDLGGQTQRITLVWSDLAISNRWLQVTVLPTNNTGLEAADVFYFGNAVGESGDSDGHTFVNGFDFAGARDNATPAALIDNAFDYNRDQLVDGADLAIARDFATDLSNSLMLIGVPEMPPLPALLLLSEQERENETIVIREDPAATSPLLETVDAVYSEVQTAESYQRAHEDPLSPERVDQALVDELEFELSASRTDV